MIKQVSTDSTPHAVLVDQSNNVIYYQKYVNPILFHYIISKRLYNLEGQIAYLKKTPSGVSFPEGAYILCQGSTEKKPKSCTGKPNLTQYNSQDRSGVVELKVAWKILEKNDIKNRYITTRATVQSYVGNNPDNPDKLVEDVLLGVVGFHIARKTASSFRWVFSTFNHIDNTRAPINSTIRPSFYDYNCPTCAINVANGGISKTQVKLIDEVSPITRKINELITRELKDDNSVLQYYQLIGTQFTTDNSKPNVRSAQGRLENNVGSNPFPTYLANEVIETFLQKANVKLSFFNKKPPYFLY